METTRKKAHLTPKILNGLLSNVRESFYLLDTGLLKSCERRTFINWQIEQILNSKLYTQVIVVGLRPMHQFETR